MADTFGSATRAPFTAIVFVFALTCDYDVILPLMLASVVAGLVAAAFLEDSLMTEKLTPRGVRVSGELHVDVLRTTLVGDVMSEEVQTIPVGATVEQAAEVMTLGGDTAPTPSSTSVGDAWRCCGAMSFSSPISLEEGRCWTSPTETWSL